MNSGDHLLSILQLFTPEKPEWTVEEAAAELQVSVSTAYRYFRSLCNAGLLDRFTSSDYILGPAIIELDRRIRITDPLIGVARPAMRRLILRSENIGPALLCRLYRNRVMCIHQEFEGQHEQHLNYERGRPMPLFLGASSKVILANLSSRSVQSFFVRFALEIAAAGLGSEWDEVKKNLRSIRNAGICITKGEVDPGHVGVAGPVMGINGKVIGSIGLVLFEGQATPEVLANSSALVQAAGREIDASLRNHKTIDAGESSSADEVTWADSSGL